MFKNSVVFYYRFYFVFTAKNLHLCRDLLAHLLCNPCTIQAMPLLNKIDENVQTGAPVVSIGKENTFDHFFRKYYAELCFFAQSIIHNEEEAKDIVQDCFIKLWDTGDVTGKTGNVKSFLFTIVRNNCINYLRKKKVVAKASLYLQNNEEQEEYFDELAFAEMVRLVLGHMEELPSRARAILTEYFLKGKRHKQIGAELSMSENAVQIQKNRAIKFLKQKLLFFF